MAYVLWQYFLKFNPKDPSFADRDRFVLSAGHGSALLYSLLHLTGYQLSIEDLKNFRQWESRTPGHPEYRKTPGVEATTGPLGQGFANAVGMAMAERALAAKFNRKEHTIVDHSTYVIASDGDMMEGVSSEAASLAGHLRLGKLIVLYADNRISIEGNTQIAFTEDVVERFSAYGWNSVHVKDGNDLVSIYRALEDAKLQNEKPTLIAVRTHIGFGSPHKQDTAKAHGEPLGVEEVRLTKEHLGWPVEPAFYIPKEVTENMAKPGLRGKEIQTQWNERFEKYSSAFPELAREFRRVIEGRLPVKWAPGQIPKISEAPAAGMATRDASEYAINSLAARFPELIGGSADLAPSTKTLIKDGGNFEPVDPQGRNLHFGVREHGMGAIVNGITLPQGLIPYCATFLIFSDYMRPPMRLAAMNQLPVIYVFTHDSIGMGEDGPTHEPVEQLLGLRSIPGMTVIRPADANETLAAWDFAIANRNGPTALILTRQKIPVLKLAQYPEFSSGVALGGYVLSEGQNPNQLDLILIATGSEVHLALDSQAELQSEGLSIRVVSLPSWNLFSTQSEEYRSETLPSTVPWLAIEAGVTLGWNSYLGPKNIEVIGVDRYGESAPGEVIMKKYGFSTDNICKKAKEICQKTLKKLTGDHPTCA